MSTTFSVGPTRRIQPGDTPDLNDGLLSRAQAAQNISRGTACFLIDGNITIATTAVAAFGHAPFVPVESVDNSGGSAGDTEMQGVAAPQRVAMRVLASSAAIDPGEYVKISGTAGQVEKWVPNVDNDNIKYARYLGKEAAVFTRNSSSPFDETLSVGIVPDQTLTPVAGATSDDNVGWFQLMESQGGAIT